MMVNLLPTARSAFSNSIRRGRRTTFDRDGGGKSLVANMEVDTYKLYNTTNNKFCIQHIARVLDDFGIKNIPLGAEQSAPLDGENAFPEGVRQDFNNFWELGL